MGDINKVANTFRFRHGYLRGKTNCAGLLATTTLEVMEPELYRWTHNSRETLCSGMTYGSKRITENTTDLEKHYKGEFGNISVNSETAIGCLFMLFPAFEAVLNGEHEVTYPVDYIGGRQRVAHYEEFEIYFVFNLGVVKVMRTEIDSFMNSLKYFDLWMKVEDTYLRGDIDCPLDEFDPLTDEIPEHRLNPIASVPLRLLNKIGGDLKSTKSVGTYFEKVGSILIEVLNRVNCDENRCNIIVRGIEPFGTCSFGTLSVVTDEMVLIEGELRDEGRNINIYKNTINRGDLGIIENKYVQRLEGWSDLEELSKMNMLGQAYYLRRRIGYLSAEIHMRKLSRRNTVSSLRFVCVVANEWIATNGEGRWLFQEGYSDLVLPNIVYGYADKSDGNQVTAFSRTELPKLTPFYLNYSRGGMYKVDRDGARELVSEWLGYSQQILILLKISIHSL